MPQNASGVDLAGPLKPARTRRTSRAAYPKGMVPLMALLPIVVQRGVAPSNGVPAALLAKLDRGVNVTRWFCYQGGPGTPEHFQTYMKAGDFAQFKRLGVHFVRLCLAPETVYDAGKPRAAAMPFVDAGVERLEKAGLAVLFDLHDNGQLKLDSTGDGDAFVGWWRAVAGRYKGKGETTRVFELVNEPVFDKNPEAWQALQNRTVAAIRAVDPKRTILVSGTGYGGIDGLLKLEPLAQKNLVYSFHCYDPFWFTHQGATWAGEAPKQIKGLEFPANAANVEAVASQMTKPYDDWVRDYGRKDNDAAYLMRRLKSASDWGKAHGVPVLLGEFGEYPPVSPPASRARWFQAMRKAIAALRLPNCLWGYDDGFGLGRSVASDGTIKVDELTAKSLYGK